MKIHKLHGIAAAICGIYLSFSPLAQAQAQNSPEIVARRALAKSEFMLRQATTEKTALEQQVTELQSQLKAMQDAQKKDIQRFSEREEKYQNVLGDIKEKYIALAEKFKKSQMAGVQQQSEIAKLQEAVAYRVDQVQSCTELNAGLLTLNNEFLAAYQDKSAWDALFQSDPVTGLTQVEIENRVQDLRDRNEDLRVSLPKEPELISNR